MPREKEAEVTITITPSGKVTVEVSGASGPACQQMTRPFTDLLADTEVRLKNEYHQQKPGAAPRQQLG